MKTCRTCKYVSGHPNGIAVVAGFCYCGRLTHEDFSIILDKITPGFVVQFCPLSLDAETECKHHVPA